MGIDKHQENALVRTEKPLLFNQPTMKLDKFINTLKEINQTENVKQKLKKEKNKIKENSKSQGCAAQ